MSKIYVVGHLNPDTDAIASAVGYAWFRSARGDGEVIAARAGPINAQTAWVLKRLGLKAPDVLADASPRVRAVMRQYDSVFPDQPLREAWAIVNRTGSVAPVVSKEGKPVGLITGLSLFRALSQRIGDDPGRGTTRLGEIFEFPSAEAADPDVPQFQAGSRIRDVLPRILRAERSDFWVVDQDGRYLGICRQRDLLNPPRLQIILVDHNELGQSIGSLDEADLLEVLDHHRLSNPPTRLPIRFRVDPVGSTSTLVSERIEDDALRPPPAIAGLLLAGVLADTLQLNSPTSTPRDRRAVERLGRWAFAPGSPLEGEDVQSFGKELLQTGAGLRTRDPASIVSGDLKVYESAGMRFAIAQVEVTDMVEAEEYREPLQAALAQLIEGRGFDFALLMVTDIVEGSSRILLQNAPAVLRELPYKRLPDGTLEARGVVSRKKQLLPGVLALLEEA